MTNSPRLRHATHLVHAMAASDGAGVKLNRIIGTPQLDMLDPFLMLDEFGSDNPQDFLAGFPDHPHRGFETVTYMLDGRMRHRDNHGNEGVLVPGGVQWMTAGRGIVHSEMPEHTEGRMRGFQLWLNLPASEKMTAPKYQEFGPDQIPEVSPAPGVGVKVIAGTVAGTTGPVNQPATTPTYLDVELAANAAFSQPLAAAHNAFVYVYEGTLRIIGGAEGDTTVHARQLAVLSAGESVQLEGGGSGSRLILVAGRPLREPVARHGPFVMNTREELMAAFEDFRAGRFQ